MGRKILCITLMLLLLSGCISAPSSSEKHFVKLYTTDPTSTSDQADSIVEVELAAVPSPLRIAEAYRDTFFHSKNASTHLPELSWRGISTDERGMVTIDFTQDGLTRVSQGSYTESSTLMGLAKSIILGDPKVNAVSYSVEGKEYASGHFIFELGVPFLTREQLKEEMDKTASK